MNATREGRGACHVLTLLFDPNLRSSLISALQSPAPTHARLSSRCLSRSPRPRSSLRYQVKLCIPLPHDRGMPNLQSFNCRTLINSTYLNVVDTLPHILGLRTWPKLISPYQGQIPPPTATSYQFQFREQGLSLGSSQRKQNSPMDMLQCGSVHICYVQTQERAAAHSSVQSNQHTNYGK